MDLDAEDIQKSFTQLVRQHPDMSVAFAAITTLLRDLETDRSETLTGLMRRMRELQTTLMQSDCAGASVRSGTELFLRFITLASLEKQELGESRRVMIERGHDFLQQHAGARGKVARLCESFIMDDMTVLTHSRSRAVRDALLAAKRAGKSVRVYVTESRPDSSGQQLQRELLTAGISCTLVLDAAVGYLMERVDCVLLGAEGVVENGGVINKIGSLTVATCAHALKRPVYVLAECVKFVRLYPLNQQQVPNVFKYSARALCPGEDGDTEALHPLVDYTPPQYVTLLMTDLGVLTPAAVSDELIQLYM